MGKRSIWHKAMDMLGSDRRLLTMPLEARGLYMMLVQRLADGDEPGVLRLTGMFGIFAEIAMLCSVPETDAETFLETLVQAGLVVRQGDTVLHLPAITMPKRRAGVGGRPRKDETREDYDRRQRELRLLRSMPAGAAGKLAETRIETPAELDAAPVQLAALEKEREEKAKLGAGGEKPAAKLGVELARAAGLDPARAWQDAAVVRKWLTLPGATMERLCEVVRTIAGRANYEAPRHLGYFNKAIREAAAGWDVEMAAYFRAVDAWNAGDRHGEAPVPPNRQAA